MAKTKKSNSEKRPTKRAHTTKGETKIKRTGRKKKSKLDQRNIDNVNTTSMTRKMLLRYLYNILEEIVRERREKSRYQQEIQVIMSYWGCSRNQLYETQVDLRHAETKLEEAVSENELEENQWKYKVMHVMYDQKQSLVDFLKEGFRNRKAVEGGIDERLRRLESDIRRLKMKDSDVVLMGDQRVKALKLQYSKEDSELRRQYYRDWMQLDNIYNRRFNILIKQYKQEQKAEIIELEKRKKQEINQLKKYHDKCFAKMKAFYGSIVLNNWYLIGTLAEKLHILRVQNECYTAEVEQREEKRIRKTNLLKQCEDDIKKYKQDLIDYKKSKVLLASLKADIQKIRRDIHDLRLQHFTLDLMYEKMEGEKKVLQQRLFMAVMEVQWKESVKTGLLHRRLDILDRATEVQGYVIQDLLEKEDLSKSEESSITEQIWKLENFSRTGSVYPISAKRSKNLKFRDVIREKDNKISTLKYEIARVTRRHHELLWKYEDKLKEYGIHKAQMGFTPLRILPKYLCMKKSVSKKMLDVA